MGNGWDFVDNSCSKSWSITEKMDKVREMRTFHDSTVNPSVLLFLPIKNDVQITNGVER